MNDELDNSILYPRRTFFYRSSGFKWAHVLTFILQPGYFAFSFYLIKYFDLQKLFSCALTETYFSFSCAKFPPNPFDLPQIILPSHQSFQPRIINVSNCEKPAFSFYFNFGLGLLCSSRLYFTNDLTLFDCLEWYFLFRMYLEESVSKCRSTIDFVWDLQMIASFG